MKRIAWYMFILAISSLLAGGCTENPLFDDNVLPRPAQFIRGEVMLSDLSTPNAVLCWLEGYNQAAYTDSTGYFELEMAPSGSMQDGSENGVFLIYFLKNNYSLAWREVVVIDGMIASNHGSIGLAGELKEPVVMEKRVDIHTSLKTTRVRLGRDTLWGNVLIRRASEDDVRFFTMGTIKRLKAGFLVPSNGGREAAVMTARPAMADNIITLNKDSILVDFNLPMTGLSIEPGEYQFVPFYQMLHQYLPDGLKEFLNYDFRSYAAAYMGVPTHYSGGNFQLII